MTMIHDLENKIIEIIDELKGLCQTNGLANQASEEVVITSVFLYKFLNDKFMANLKDFAKEIDMDYTEVLKNENDEMDAFYDSYPQVHHYFHQNQNLHCCHLSLVLVFFHLNYVPYPSYVFFSLMLLCLSHSPP